MPRDVSANSCVSSSHPSYVVGKPALTTSPQPAAGRAAVSSTHMASSMQADRKASAQDVSNLPPTTATMLETQSTAAGQAVQRAGLACASISARAFMCAEARHGVDHARSLVHEQLIRAVRQDNAEAAKAAAGLMTRKEINHISSCGDTALTLAVRTGNQEIVKYLLSRLETPEEINKILPNGHTALTLAVELPYNGVFNVLLDALRAHPGSINFLTDNGVTALSSAIGHWNMEAIHRLLDALATNGPAANSPKNVDHYTIHKAGIHAHFGVLLTWLSSGAGEELVQTFFDAFDYEHSWRAIHPATLLIAADAGCAPVVSVLLRRGIDADVRWQNGEGVVELAVKNGHFAVLEAWMASGRLVSDQQILDCLHASIDRDRSERGTRPIVDHGTSQALNEPQQSALEPVEEKRSAVLIQSIQKGWVHLAEALVLGHARALGVTGRTDDVIDALALERAGELGQFDVLFTELVLRGASEDIAEAFFKGFAGVSPQPKIHEDALLEAGRFGYARIVFTLLAFGDDADRKAENGLSALDLAINNGHLSVLNAWLASGREVTSDQILNAIDATSRYGARSAQVHPLKAVDASGRTVLMLAQTNGWTYLEQALKLL